MVLALRKRLHKSDVRCRPRQGPKPGRKRRWRGFPGAPSGAGRGDMFGRGSYAIVRRCKSSIFFRSNSERDGGICVLADTKVFVGGSARRCALPTQRSLARRIFRSTLRVADTAFTCEKEVPLDAARCRCSVHWREGGSARRCASRGMTCTAHGAKEGKDGRRRWCHWQRRAFPRRPSFPFPSSGDARHSAADDRRWRNPILAKVLVRAGSMNYRSVAGR